MFTRKTVFIVGAGGSFEVGLPVGDKLKEMIATKLNIKFDGWERKSGDASIVQALQWQVEQQGRRDINEYRQAAIHISEAMPMAISIDNFLHTHSHNDKIVFMGKMGIAACILAAEQSSHIRVDPDKNQGLNFSTLKPHWHSTFTKMLLEGLTVDNTETMFEKVGFITFNYDRCIEHYLTHALVNQLRIRLEQAQFLVNRLRIIHPYGQIGKLPWQTQDGKGTAYGEVVEPRNLIPIAQQIKTFTERVDDDDMLARMHSLIAEAEMIVYLGFSYGDMNMELMKIRGEADQRHILGTSLGLSLSNKHVIERDIRQAMGPSSIAVTSLELADMTCNDLLSAYQRFILRG